MIKLHAHMAYRNAKLGTATIAPKKVPEPNTTIDVAPRLTIGVWRPFSLIAGLKLKEETVNQNHLMVQGSPLRQAISKMIGKEAHVKDLLWRESLGAIELGPALCTSLPALETPFGLGLSFDLGFETTSLLAYRYTRPGRVYDNGKKDEALSDHLVPFPLTVADAQSMPIGREVEICGAGRMRMRGGVSITEGVGVMGLAKAGVGAFVGASGGIAGEYALSITALDGKNLVRVSIKNTNENLKDLSFDFRAGLLCATSSAIPSFGQGALPSMAHGACSGLLGTAMTSFGSAVAHLGSGVIKRHNVICAFDLDLTKEAAQKAYAGLLKLNTDPADILMAEKDSGINKVSLKEFERSDYTTTDFKALSQQIWGQGAANIEHQGKLIKPGSTILYHDQVHCDKSENWFTGSRELLWEGITVKDDKGRLHTYYRFKYERNNTIPEQAFVDRHFTLARRLGIKSDVKADNTLLEMTGCNKFLSGEDDVKVSTEIFFTEEGVNRIQKANKEQATAVFQTANSDIVLEEEKLVVANALLKQYQKLAAERWAFQGPSEEMQGLSRQYENHFKRNFTQDLELYNKAVEFGKFIEPFTKAHDSKSARNFFACLGSSDFDFTEIIAALASLAGRSNVKVHNLSVSGGDVLIKSADEGAILHPRTGVDQLPNAKPEDNVIAYA